MKAIISHGKLLLLVLISSSVIGLVIGSFLFLLAAVTNLRLENDWLVFLGPSIALLTVFMYRKYGKRSELGNNLLIDSIHEEHKIPLRMSVLTYGFTLLSHLAGASVGREGTGVQIGGTIGAKVGDYLKLNEEDRKILTKAGISAGFGSIFGTPLGGAFFGLEMTSIGKIRYEAVIPCLISSAMANLVCSLLPVRHSSYEIGSLPAFSIKLLLVVMAGALLFGLTGRLFAKAVVVVKGFYARVIKNDLLRAFAGSLIVMLILLIPFMSNYSGLGLALIERGFEGTASFFDPAMKFILTVLSLGAGFQGGEATPLFAIGASLGGFLGSASGISPALLAGLGLIGVFGSATNTPLTTIILGVELYGTAGLPYYILTAVIGYYAMGHNSIYSSQRVLASKHPGLSQHRGKSIREIHEERKR